jgi:hypothetical protein
MHRKMYSHDKCKEELSITIDRKCDIHSFLERTEQSDWFTFGKGIILRGTVCKCAHGISGKEGKVRCSKSVMFCLLHTPYIDSADVCSHNDSW